MISVTIKHLRAWKREHTEETFEDYGRADMARGLFAVADGSGSSLFADEWARRLVEAFLATPLRAESEDGPVLDADAFETDWWLRRAQDEFRPWVAERTPPDTGRPDSEHWNTTRKAGAGTFSTLAAGRVVERTDTSVRIQLLFFGDTCALLARSVNDGDAAADDIASCPYDRAEQFNGQPRALPSRVVDFVHHYHRPTAWTVELHAHDRLMLATDAVARWIIRAGEERPGGARAAFDAVAACTQDDFADFIESCRKVGMVDDDSTALILNVGTSPPDASSPSLDVAAPLLAEIIGSREDAIRDALANDDKDALARAYGNGTFLDPHKRTTLVEPSMLRQAREVSRAFVTVRNAVSLALFEASRRVSALNPAPDQAALAAQLAAIWIKWGNNLRREPCAEGLRQTLRNNGVDPDYPEAGVSATPPSCPAVVGESEEGKTQSPPHGEHLPVPETEREEIRIVPAIAGFRDALRADPPWQIEKIHVLWEQIADASRLALTERERAVGALAQRYDTAIRAGDMSSIREARAESERLEIRFALDEFRSERVVQIEERAARADAARAIVQANDVRCIAAHPADANPDLSDAERRTFALACSLIAALDAETRDDATIAVTVRDLAAALPTLSLGADDGVVREACMRYEARTAIEHALGILATTIIAHPDLPESEYRNVEWRLRAAADACAFITARARDSVKEMERYANALDDPASPYGTLIGADDRERIAALREARDLLQHPGPDSDDRLATLRANGLLAGSDLESRDNLLLQSRLGPRTAREALVSAITAKNVQTIAATYRRTQYVLNDNHLLTEEERRKGELAIRYRDAFAITSKVAREKAAQSILNEAGGLDWFEFTPEEGAALGFEPSASG